MQEQFQHFFAVIEMEWPKALIGSVIPISQYAWKLWSDRQVEARKNFLRERIRQLAQFIQAPLPDAPDAPKVRHDAEIEYAEAVARLAELCGHEKRTAAIHMDTGKDDLAVVARTRTVSQAIAVTPAPVPAEVTSALEHEPAPPTEAAAYTAAAAEPSRIDVVASRAAATPPPARNWFRRWFLLYVPKRPLAWIPQTLFFAVLSFTFFAAIGILSDPGDSDFWSGILALLAFLGVALLLRMWALRANAEPAEHRPSSKKPRRWVPITVTIVGIFYELGFFIGFSTDDDDNFSSTIMRGNLLAIFAATLIIGAIVFAFWYRWRRRTLSLRKAAPDSLEAKTSP